MKFKIIRIKLFLEKPDNTPTTIFQSHQNVPSPTNEISAAKTSSPSSTKKPRPSVQSTQSKIPHMTIKPRTNPKQQFKCQIRNQAEWKVPWPAKWKLLELTPYIPSIGWACRCVTNFSAITLKKKLKMSFAPMDSNNLSMDTLIDSGGLVNGLLENDLEKIQTSVKTRSLKKQSPNIWTTCHICRHRCFKQNFPTTVWNRGLYLQINVYSGHSYNWVYSRPTFLRNNSAIRAPGTTKLPHLTYAIALDKTEYVSRNQKTWSKTS